MQALVSEAGVAQHAAGSGAARERLAIALIAAAAFLAHLLTIGGYGYFRDELYYLACANHLAFGYVDHPPLSILLLAGVRSLLGDSLLALRLLPALAAPLLVLLTARLTREMGGSGFAPVLAALAVFMTPVLLAIMSFYSMNAFEPLFWTAAAYLVARIINTGNEKLWGVFGAIAGLGLQNKHSMLFFCFGVVAGLLLTEHRQYLWSKWLLLGGAVAVLIFLPNLIWEAAYGWPTLEFMRNAQAYKNYHASLPEFVLGQILQTNPLIAPVWIAGLYYYLGSREGRRYRLFGWAYAAIFALLVVQGAKAYYLASVYPTMLAGGAILLARFFRARGLWLLRTAYVSLIVIGGIAAAPLVMPILPPAVLARHIGVLGSLENQKVLEGERHQLAALPQIFADRFGWPEMVAAAADVYRGLSPEEQSHCAIFASNYGEAGAIDFFGRKYGLPRAISNHNNYWLWGPGSGEPEVVIVLNARQDELEKGFKDVRKAAVFRCQYCMPFENNLAVYVCRGPKHPIAAVWSRLKHYL